jgi:hypothetical protein
MDMPEVIRRAGGLVKLAKAAGRHHATILGWTRVPPQHVRAVSAATGLSAHELRPDLWDPPAGAEPPPASPPDGPQPAANDTTKSKAAPRRSRTPTTQAAQAEALEPKAA